MPYRICNVCNSKFFDDSKFKPRSNCSSSCGDYVKYKNALENVLIALELDSDAIKLIRGDMFRLANILSNGTKTLKH